MAVPLVADPQSQPTTKVFGRLLRMLRPHYGTIGLGLLLLVLGSPCELFPAIVWQFVTDDIVLRNVAASGAHHPGRFDVWLRAWFSFGGRIANPFPLLVSSVLWLFAVYLIG